MTTDADPPRSEKTARKKARTKRQRPSIGWREWVALPELGIEAVRAKIDTGAASSSLHAFDLQRFERRGTPWVRFEIHPLQRSKGGAVVAEAPLAGEKLVRNPGGRQELRPFVDTEVAWNGHLWRIRLNLTSRDEMGFRMLLGREAVRRRFLVDPGRSFLGDAPTPPEAQSPS